MQSFPMRRPVHPSSSRESERLCVDVEQAQSTGAVVVVCRHAGRVVAEAIGVYARRLGLELSGELADVVLSKEIANQRISFLARKTEQAGETLAEPAVTCQQRLTDRGHVEGVIRKRMPLGSAVRVRRLSLSPEIKDVHRASWW